MSEKAVREPIGSDRRIEWVEFGGAGNRNRFCPTTLAILADNQQLLNALCSQSIGHQWTGQPRRMAVVCGSNVQPGAVAPASNAR